MLSIARNPESFWIVPGARRRVLFFMGSFLAVIRPGRFQVLRKEDAPIRIGAPEGIRANVL